MENFHPTAHDSGYVVNGHVTPQRAGALAPQHPRHDLELPRPVSLSSYLNEEDRRYRGGMNIEGGAELVRRTMQGVKEMDADVRQARVDGTSPLGLTILEELELKFGRAATYVITDYMTRPYERW